MKYSCYQDCSVIHGWFVYCAFCWQMHRLSKSLEIRFRMASFSKISLLTCPCLRCKRVEKSQAILETWWPSEAASRLVSLSNYCLWCVFFSVSCGESSERLKFIHEQWSNLQWYQVLKAFGDFLTANSKKRFRRLFSYDFGCKQKALSDFLASSTSWKRANTGSRLKT